MQNLALGGKMKYIKGEIRLKVKNNIQHRILNGKARASRAVNRLFVNGESGYSLLVNGEIGYSLLVIREKS
jgi:hypothetical protein